ncbi:hypothetical protein BC829DRAFT_211025 [Chytridium lagenaria]|nr:hypothetical protein BC829DRAFT_211025 [Chytridium lagenaria]
MTLPDACVQSNEQLKDCIAQYGFTGRLFGKCEALKQMFEECMRVEFSAKRKKNLEESIARRQNWETRDKEVGLGSASGR